MKQIDYGIDLHTGGAQRHNYPQTRFTSEDENSKKLAEIFSAPFTFPSRLISGSFRKAAFSMGKPSIVFEAGESMRFDDYAILEGMQGVLNVLKHFEMITRTEPAFVERHNSFLLSDRKWMRAPTAGMFIPEVVNGSQVQKGQELGLITDTYAKHKRRIKAPFDGHVLCINHQAVVNQGDALFHIGR